MTATEQVILVNEHDEKVGVAEKIQAHREGLRHRAFSIFIFREKPQFELLLQQRALDKYHSKGLWTNTCCSHPRPGEDLISAGKRRLFEELGIVAELKNVGWFHYNAKFENGMAENEIDHVLVGIVPADVSVNINPAEVRAYRWVEIGALKQEMRLNPEMFTVWLERALKLTESNPQ